MRAYLNEETQLVEIFNGEPDEVITREEFDNRNRRIQRDARIEALEKELAELYAEREADTSQVSKDAGEVEPEVIPAVEVVDKPVANVQTSTILRRKI